MGTDDLGELIHFGGGGPRPAAFPTKPGPQPHNQIAGTAVEQLARCSSRDGRPTTADAQAALEGLAAAGLGEWEDTDRGTPGRPTTRFVLRDPPAVDADTPDA